MLLFGKGNSPQGGAGIDAHAGRCGVGGCNAGIEERHQRAGEGDLREPVETARFLRRHEIERLERDFGGDAGGKPVASNAVMAATADSPRRTPSQRPSTPLPIAVMGPMPVIATRRRTFTRHSSLSLPQVSRSTICLIVFRVSPAM